jgi:hypothetical protein
VPIFNGNSYSDIQKYFITLYNTCLMTRVLAQEPLKQLISCKSHLELSSLLYKIKNGISFLEIRPDGGRDAEKVYFILSYTFCQEESTCTFCIYYAFGQNFKHTL